MVDRWSEAIAQYCVWLAAGGAAKGTIKIRKSYLGRLAAQNPAGPWDVRSTDLLIWMGTDTWQAEARKSARAAARGFYRWAHLAEHIPSNPAANLPTVKVPRAVARPAPDRVMASALARADGRERLMVLLGARGGLRRGEICKVRGIDLVEGNVLRVTGKGGHTRLVPIMEPELIIAMENAGADYLFPGHDNGHISADWTGVLLSRLLGPGWTGHTLRHRCATRAYAGTRDLRSVQELLGHASPLTTARYTAVVTEDLRKAVIAAA